VSELTPTFEIAVTLDGDDYPPTATESVRLVLEETLKAMVTTRLIRGYALDLKVAA
jgi:hypothetical protein